MQLFRSIYNQLTSAIRGALISDIFKLASGTTAVQIVSILSTPFITRMYAPEAFGQFSLIVSITSILSIIAALRYEMAIPLPKKDSEGKALFLISLLCVLSVTCVYAVLMHFFDDRIVIWLNAPDILPYLYLTPIYLFLLGLNAVLIFWMTRKKYYGSITLGALTGAVLTAFIKLSGGFLGHNHSGTLLLATILGLGTQNLLLISAVYKDFPLKSFSPHHLALLSHQAKRYKKFPLVDSFGALLNNASWQLPPILFAYFFSPAIVGFYALTFRFIQLPMQLIGKAIGQVTYQRLAVAKENNQPLEPLLLPVIKKLILISTMPSMAFLFFGKEIFSFVFGNQWIVSGEYASILSIWMFVWLIASPTSHIFHIFNRQGLLLKYQIAIFSSKLLSVLIGAAQNNITLTFIYLAATGFLIYGALLFHTVILAKVSFKKFLLLFIKTVFLPWTTACIVYLSYLFFRN